MKGTHTTTGFSLIELLIVVAIISIIAAIAVPNLLQSKAAANEAAALSYMRSWTSAQELYHTKFGAYADADSQLFNEGLINKGAADSHGYTFSLDNPSGSQNSWWGTGEPDTPGQTGSRFFFIDETGVMRFSTSGSATSSSPPL
jgi:prepilin-type N-terminal cleavage/methylation domain-containing protein